MPNSETPNIIDPMSRRVAVSIQAAIVLFAVAAAVSWLVLRRSPHYSGAALAVVISVPAIASLVLALILNALESLLPAPRITFPVNVTLPLIHCSLMALLVSLILTSPTAFEAPPGPIAIARMFQSWLVLLACALLEIAALTLIGVVEGPK